MSALTRKGFPAQYPGDCVSCGAAILPDDRVFYATGNERVSGVDCCGDKDDADLVVVQRRDDSGEDDESPVEAIAKVMPRGRTARDMCGRCFQVPANNGTCGCDD